VGPVLDSLVRWLNTRPVPDASLSDAEWRTTAAVITLVRLTGVSGALAQDLGRMVLFAMPRPEALFHAFTEGLRHLESATVAQEAPVAVPSTQQAEQVGAVFRALLDVGVDRAYEPEGTWLVRPALSETGGLPISAAWWSTATHSEQLERLRDITRRTRRRLEAALSSGTDDPPAELLVVPSRIPAGDWYVRAGVRDATRGAHHTPPGVVDEVVEHTLAPLVSRCASRADILNLRICDPAVGAGAFLLGALRFLVAEARRHEDHLESAEPLAQRIARTCLFGADIDPLAVGVARAALWLAADRPPEGVPGAHLVWGDALVGLSPDHLDTASRMWAARGRSPEAPPLGAVSRLRLGDAVVAELAKRSRPVAELAPWIEGVVARPGFERSLGFSNSERAPPVHWAEAFPKVGSTASPGFDAVLTNPPYRSAVGATASEHRTRKVVLRSLHPAFTLGAFDLSTVFWSRVLTTLLAPGGRYGLVVPTASLSSTAGWQARVHARWRPDTLVLYPVDRFFDARVRTTAVIGGEGTAEQVTVVNRDVVPPATGVVDWRAVDGPWFAATRLDRRAPRVQRPTVPLSELFSISAGCSTEVAYRLAEVADDNADEQGVQLVTTGALDRYHCHWGAKTQRFLGRDYRYPRWPRDLPQSGMQRAVARQARPKILVAGLTAVLEAWLDEDGHTAGVVQTWVVCPVPAVPKARLWPLLGLLNSALFSQLYLDRHGGAAMSGGQTTIKKRALQGMPIPAAFSLPDLDRWAGGWADVWSEHTSDSALIDLLGLLSRRCQRPAGARPLESVDLATHAVVARLYGVAAAPALASLAWWCARSGLGEAPAEWPVEPVDRMLRGLSATRDESTPAPCEGAK
jgi:hypothetical protein